MKYVRKRIMRESLLIKDGTLAQGSALIRPSLSLPAERDLNIAAKW